MTRRGSPLARRILTLDSAIVGAEFLEDLFARKEEFLGSTPFRGIGDAESFHTKVVGVTFEGRQGIVGSLQAGDELALLRQPENPYDAHAIAVCYGELQLGFLRREIARELAPLIDAGRSHRVMVSERTGGGARNTGLNIHVSRCDLAPQRVRAGPSPRFEGDTPPGTGAEAAVRRALLGERQLREAQVAVLERVYRGDRTLAVLGTGRGKSLCFQLPAAVWALERGAKTLVLYPLRALANDQYEAMRRRLEPLGLRILRANGAIEGAERTALFEALQSGSWDIALSTPEFLQFHGERFMQAVSRPELLVIDEAHHLFEAKHRPAYRRIGDFIERSGIERVLALTATARGESFAELRRVLGITRWVIDPTVRENLELVDARRTKEKSRYLLEQVILEDGKAIIYCNSRVEATNLAESLRAHQRATAFYHAGMGLTERAEVERLFREGGLRVVVATSAFGEGIDLPDVRNVVMYHLSFNFTEFNQQAGRAGRDGGPARIHLLYGERDRRINDFILSKTAPTVHVLRELYRGMRRMAGEVGMLRMAYTDIARTLDIERVDDATVGVAVRIFNDAGLMTLGVDDDGRFLRFLPCPSTVDVTETSRYAEGVAERENFENFCELALHGNVLDLQRIVNRPIYPDGLPLRR